MPILMASYLVCLTACTIFHICVFPPFTLTTVEQLRLAN
uniref:Uncharacterized protein n=1 Tax=Arundo donax TaxID=35708 RepID=A0A0A9AMF6_ARUDO